MTRLSAIDAGVTLNDQLAEKLPLIGRVARGFIHKTPAIEYDDAVQVVSIAAWRILLNPDDVDDVDDAIVYYGYNRLIDEVRTGRTGWLKRGQLRDGHSLPYSLNALMNDGEGSPTEFGDMLLDPEGDPHERALNERLVGEGLAVLPERIRLVLFLRFFEDLKLADIADMLGVSESRISQLCTQGLLLMRLKIAA